MAPQFEILNSVSKSAIIKPIPFRSSRISEIYSKEKYIFIAKIILRKFNINFVMNWCLPVVMLKELDKFKTMSKKGLFRTKLSKSNFILLLKIQTQMSPKYFAIYQSKAANNWI